MWAQLIKVRLKPEKVDELSTLAELLWATEQPGSGLIRSTAVRDRNDPTNAYMMVVFPDEETASARESDDRRAEPLGRARALMAEILDGPPEFVDLDEIGEFAPPSR